MTNLEKQNNASSTYTFPAKGPPSEGLVFVAGGAVTQWYFLDFSRKVLKTSSSQSCRAQINIAMANMSIPQSVGKSIPQGSGVHCAMS